MRHKLSHKQLILRQLERGPVCATTLLEDHMPRYAARILDLRQEGNRIVTERCNRMGHEHQTRQVQYRLITNVKAGGLF